MGSRYQSPLFLSNLHTLQRTLLPFQVNGILVQLPRNISKAVSITESHGSIVIDQSSTMQILFSPSGEVSVRVKDSLAGKMCAPCGNFNGDVQDDLRLPTGQIANGIVEVVDAWKARDFSEW